MNGLVASGARLVNLGSARAAASRLVRRGGRTVLWGYSGMGLGNYLYLLLRADARQARGRDYRIGLGELWDQWREHLPLIEATLTVPEDQIRWWDRRDELAPSYFQGYGTDFTGEELVAFIGRFVLGSPLLVESGVETGTSETLTVNVRRGDYYSHPGYRSLYAFDVVAYVRAALEASVRASGRPRSIHVVSDGMDWCRTNLSWLAEHADELTFADPTAGPATNLAEVALSRRLIITNSTFSFWGAYISNVVHGDNHSEVWAPRFFHRGIDGGRPWQLDPRWSVVENIPGGWGPPQ